MAGVAVVTLVGAMGCREAKPPAPAPQSQPEVIIQPAPQSMPVTEVPATKPAAESQPVGPPRYEDMSDAGPIKKAPTTQSDKPLTILSKFDGMRRGRLSATLDSETLMTMATDNVRALRLDLLKLPRKGSGRLILQIDGQGIEVTGKNNQIIYLQRSAIGEWSFGRAAEVPAAGGK